MKITKKDINKFYLLYADGYKYIIRIKDVEGGHLCVRTELVRSLDIKRKLGEFYALTSEGTWNDVKIIEEINENEYPEYFI